MRESFQQIGFQVTSPKLGKIRHRDQDQVLQVPLPPEVSRSLADRQGNAASIPRNFGLTTNQKSPIVCIGHQSFLHFWGSHPWFFHGFWRRKYSSFQAFCFCIISNENITRGPTKNTGFKPMASAIEKAQWQRPTTWFTWWNLSKTFGKLGKQIRKW